MTKEEIQHDIQSLEDRIQRKKQEISRDEAAILKCDSNVMSAEWSMAVSTQLLFGGSKI